GAEELMEFLDSVTTHETSFFRNLPQLDAFRTQVMPRLLAAQDAAGRRVLRLWSAACSSGEEPYTLAMILLEALGAEAPRWRIQIVGTDIARSMLEKAREGVYTRYSFRTTPAYFAQKYFDIEGPDAFRLKEAPRKLVEFHLLNFADDARMRLMRGFQVIFCRNALIYFDREAKARFVSHFARALDPEGYLFVGHSESLHGVSGEFKLVHFAGALAYAKPSPDRHEEQLRCNPIG
ncbi:MAG: CheR family methyltransferase, partial [Deferrisomatales bacterium]